MTQKTVSSHDDENRNGVVYLVWVERLIKHPETERRCGFAPSGKPDGLEAVENANTGSSVSVKGAYAGAFPYKTNDGRRVASYGMVLSCNLVGVEWKADGRLLGCNPAIEMGKSPT